MEPTKKSKRREEKEDITHEDDDLPAFPPSVVEVKAELPKEQPPLYYPPDEIIPGVWVGDLKNAQNTEELNKLGITGIICCVLDLKSFSFQPGFSHLFLTWQENRHIPCLEADIKKINLFIEHHQKKNQGVLIHDQMGISAVSVAIMGHLMSAKHLTYDQAWTLLRKKRPHSDPVPIFKEQMKDLEE